MFMWAAINTRDGRAMQRVALGFSTGTMSWALLGLPETLAVALLKLSQGAAPYRIGSYI